MVNYCLGNLMAIEVVTKLHEFMQLGTSLPLSQNSPH